MIYRHQYRDLRGLKLLAIASLVVSFLLVSGCGAVSIGKWKGLEHTPSDENYWLVKDIFLAAGSAHTRKDTFDHNMHEDVNLFFIPKDERNYYVAESRWIDPSGQEYRTIRTTYDMKEERKTGEERDKKGTTRIHNMSVRELVNHKPGMWKVALYLNDKLVRRLSFTVR
jgi:hypothetical protein